MMIIKKTVQEIGCGTAGQCFHRAIVALGEVRTDLPGGLCRRAAAVGGTGELFPVLQPKPAASGAGLPDAGRGVRFMRRAAGSRQRLGLRPKPRDLALSARLTVSLLKKPSGCRTIKEPRRKTGQRRDATRAPGEVRTDRAVAIPPSEPAAIHLRKGRKLSSPWGPPHGAPRRKAQALQISREALFLRAWPRRSGSYEITTNCSESSCTF
jgi:hypothetical protein